MKSKWSAALAVLGLQWPVPGMLEVWKKTVLRKRYRRLARERHPDIGGDTAAFQALNQAHELLASATVEDIAVAEERAAEERVRDDGWWTRPRAGPPTDGPGVMEWSRWNRRSGRKGRAVYGDASVSACPRGHHRRGVGGLADYCLAPLRRGVVCGFGFAPAEAMLRNGADAENAARWGWQRGVDFARAFTLAFTAWWESRESGRPGPFRDADAFLLAFGKDEPIALLEGSKEREG